jgi:hypothetical protein
MKTAAALALIATLALAGCETSGFKVATDANTDRAKEFQDNILLQAGHDLSAIHACYLRAAGYALVPGKEGQIQKVAEPSSAEGCTVMAMGLRTQSNMLTAFAPSLARDLMSRVPAAPEEIAQALAEKGMQFALMKFGIEQVASVINSGQAASYQIATQAQAKHPIVMQPGVLAVTPDGASVLMPASAASVNP